MCSSAWEKIQADVDTLNAAVSRFQALSWEALTPAELVDALERYAFFIGWLDALMCELRSPFARLGGTRR